MVSDVDNDRCSLVTAGSPAGRFEQYEGDVYGRSAENILYRVFGIGTSGNFYIESDLATALQMISGRREMVKSELEAIIARLERVAAKDNMPMRLIIDQGKALVSEL